MYGARPELRSRRGGNRVVNRRNSMKSKLNRRSGSKRASKSGAATAKVKQAAFNSDRARSEGGHVTLRDVAIAAGVSPMSVSNFINARLGAMRPETRARIQAEIGRLGYRPNAVARNL